MAAPCQNAVCRGKTLFSLLMSRLPKQAFPSLTQWRSSQYAKRYNEPLMDTSGLEKREIKGKLVKAATLNQSTVFNYDQDVNSFINRLMYDSDKIAAREIVERMFEMIKRTQIESYHKSETEAEKKNIELNPVKVFHTALDNCKPVIMTIGVVKGGVKFQVPIPCPPKVQTRMAMKWMIDICREKKGRMHVNLAYELLEAYRNEGRTVRKKQELHRFCEQNRAYAHYRWW